MLGTPHPWPCVRGAEEDHATRENSSLMDRTDNRRAPRTEPAPTREASEGNVKRGAKMHAARLKSEANGAKRISQHKQSIGGARSMTECRRMTGSAIT